ncbi:MAG: tRNA (guanosine(46)-N7)-methyltransferase TrmB [Alphaproteobacteria bacterium]|nr:tRNA (guanosine(46)-N7)-methyltransferase TrmB [Alphaproteobacteria bacterium]
MTRRDIPGALNGSRLLEQPRYAAEVAAWRAALRRNAPVLLEIGFDHGRRLAATAARWPGWQVVGMEVRRRRVTQVERIRATRGLTNLLPWRVDARTALATVTPPACLDVVEVLFPTPWWDPKLRAKRLLLTPPFVADVARALRPGGALIIATDVDEIAAAVAEALASCPTLAPDPLAWAARPAIDARSRREWRCAQDGLEVHRFGLRRLPAADV